MYPPLTSQGHAPGGAVPSGQSVLDDGTVTYSKYVWSLILVVYQLKITVATHVTDTLITVCWTRASSCGITIASGGHITRAYYKLYRLG